MTGYCYRIALFLSIAVVSFASVLAGVAHAESASEPPKPGLPTVYLVQSGNAKQKECHELIGDIWVELEVIKAVCEPKYGCEYSEGELKKIYMIYYKASHQYNEGRFSQCVATAQSGVDYIAETKLLHERAKLLSEQYQEACHSALKMLVSEQIMHAVIDDIKDRKKYEALSEKLIDYMVADDNRECSEIAEELRPIYKKYEAKVVAARAEAERAEGEKYREIGPIAPLMANADPVAGEEVAKMCIACHSFDQWGVSKLGPPLWGIVNRRPASIADYSYSGSMIEFGESGVIWDYEQLNRFLAKPRLHIPKLAMSFAGIDSPDTRANLIAYLRTMSDSPAPLP